MLKTAITVRATGAAEPAEVWRRWVDLDEWPRWSPQIAEVRCGARRIAAGLTGRVVSVIGVSAAFEIISVDRSQRRWEWRVRVLGLTFLMDHQTGPASRAAEGGTADGGTADGATTNGGTTTSVRIEGFGPAVLAYAPIARLALGRVVRP